MHPPSQTRILELLSDDDLLLDVGGWARPFVRTDWMLDLGEYETRGELGTDGEGEERFTEDTWVQRDICDKEPWPFEDKMFDFAICSQTLEDIRDPIWVCQELQRVAKAGYIEVPSRLEEQSWGFQGRWVGWGHHHWLIDVDQEASAIQFVFKHHVIHSPGPDHFDKGFFRTLTAEQKIQTLWWEGSFEATERMIFTADELHEYLREFVAANGPPAPFPEPPSPPPSPPGRLRRLLGRG